jgi:hypothetical protein
LLQRRESHRLTPPSSPTMEPENFRRLEPKNVLRNSEALGRVEQYQPIDTPWGVQSVGQGHPAAVGMTQQVRPGGTR